MLIRILILFTLVSCTKFIEVKKSNGLHYAEKVYSKLEKVKEVEWNVGRKREVNISKGVRLHISIPGLSEDAKNILGANYGVDSWIYRINRVRRGAVEPLGYYFFNLGNMTRTTKNFTLSLFYHAASVSKRFRLFHCPAFNHRSKIEDFDINASKLAEPKDLFVRPIERVPAKVTRLRFAPMIQTGGISLKGQYTIDYALYNVKTKRRYSKWHRVDGVLDIQREVVKSIPSCLGIKEELKPLPESRVPNIRDLEIK